MQITGSVALVTGANRGLGRQFVLDLLERGARKVYATARRPELVSFPNADGRVEVLRLDVTDPAAVAAAAAAAAAQDVTLLVNNAGVQTSQRLVTGDLAEIRREMETHYFGTLHIVRAFAPVLARHGGGAVLNVLSVIAWLAYDGVGAYSAAKAAAWGLTNNVRLELAAQGTLVTGLHVGSIDTDMMAGWDVPKNAPADVVRAALDGVEAGRLEVLADDASTQVKAALSADPSALYPQLHSPAARAA